jgi:hypothetical protein
MWHCVPGPHFVLKMSHGRRYPGCKIFGLYFAVFGVGILSNWEQVYGRSLILRRNVQALIQQLDELQELRDRVRRAEARLGVPRCKRRIPRERIVLSRRMPAATSA